MPDDPNQVKELIGAAEVDKAVKRGAWDAYYDAKSPEDFQQRFSQVKLPDSTMRQLYTMKFGIELPPDQQAPPGATPQFAPGSQPYPDYPQGKLTGKELAGMAVSAIPAITAGVGGFALGPPGAALFGAGGEAVRQGVVSLVGPENLSGPTVKTQPSPRFPEAAQQVLSEGAQQGVNEGVGRAMFLGTRGALGGPLHKASVTPENLPVREAAEKYGLRLTAPEIAGKTKIGRSARMLQRLGEYSIFSQKSIEQVREAGVEAGLEGINRILDRLHPPTSPNETGTAVRGLFELGHDTFQRVATGLYNDLDQAAQGVMVNMRAVKSEAARILAKAQRTQQFVPRTGGTGSQAEKILLDAAEAPDWVPFSVAHDWRVKLGQITPQADQLMAGEAKGIAKDMFKHVTDAMETSAAALKPDVLTKWNAARDFYKRGADLFDHAVVNGLMNRDHGPEMIATAIKEGGVDTAKRIRAAILDYPMKYGDQADKRLATLTWRQFQEQFVRSNLLKDAEAQGGEFATEKFLSDPRFLKKKLDSFGPGVLQEVFGTDTKGKQVLSNLRDIGESFARVHKLPVEGRRWVYTVMQLGILGAASGVGMAEHSIGKGVAAELGFEALPMLITHGMYNPKATGYMLDGIGGLMKAWEGKSAFTKPFKIPMQAGGKAVTKATNLLFTPGAEKYMGTGVADIMRAAQEINRDREMLRKDAKATASKVDPLHNPYDEDQ